MLTREELEPQLHNTEPSCNGNDGVDGPVSRGPIRCGYPAFFRLRFPNVAYEGLDGPCEHMDSLVHHGRVTRGN